MKYTIKKNDTLSAIARNYNTTVAEIKKANPNIIKDVNKIMVGWVIEIPQVKKVDYAAIGKKFVECMENLDDMKCLDELLKML